MSNIVIDESQIDKRVYPNASQYKTSTFGNIVTGSSSLLIIAIGALFIWGFATTLLALIEFMKTAPYDFTNGARINPNTVFSSEETLLVRSIPSDPTSPLVEVANPTYNPRFDYMFWVRWSVGGYVLAFFLYYPTRWLNRSYGRQSFVISDEGIVIKRFPIISIVVILIASVFSLTLFYFAILSTPSIATFMWITWALITGIELLLLRKLIPNHRNNATFSIPWEGVLDITVKKSDSIFTVFSETATKITVYTMDKAITVESITLVNNTDLARKLKVYGDSLDERVIDFGYGATIAIVWRRIKRSKVGVFGASLVVLWIGISIFASAINLVVPHSALESQLRQRTMFNLWNPVYVNIDESNQAPSARHWFGTDAVGRDYFSRIIFGAFYSILIGVVATLITTFLGGVIGASSAYIGGTTDQIVQRVTEVLNAMPGLPLLILISASFTPLLSTLNIEGAYYLVVFGIFAFIGWGGVARIIRSEVLSLKNSEFIQAERVLGATHWRIISRHIIPNTMSTILIFFTLGVASAITAVASLSFIGFGSASTLVWGKDLSDSFANLPTEYWWGPTFISLALFSLVLGFNLFGDALRDALDPRLKN